MEIMKCHIFQVSSWLLVDNEFTYIIQVGVHIYQRYLPQSAYIWDLAFIIQI